MSLKEGRFVFDFSAARRAIKWDGPETYVPETMKKVDFVVEETARWLLVEIKAPSHPCVTEAGRASFRKRLKSGRIVNTNLVPKCRDTFTYMHLMQMKGKPLVFVVVISD